MSVGVRRLARNGHGDLEIGKVGLEGAGVDRRKDRRP